MIEDLAGEAGADAAPLAEDGMAGWIVVADQQGTESSGSLALALGPATDHELLAQPDLDLPPYVQRFVSMARVSW